MDRRIRVAWQEQRILAVTCLSMLVLFAANLVGLAIDPRVITGSPAWLKPAKFSISIAIYSGTLAWILSEIVVWPKFVRLMATVTTVALWVEVFIINLQAWRGTSSHFNVGTNVDAALFACMGISIAILWLASAGVARALFHQKFDNRPFGWALRLGMLITVLGSASGGLMTHPMPGQAPGTIGAHTIGAPDGGAGMAVTNWSANHGDLRIGHFVGLHGMQVIPLLYWLLSLRNRPSAAVISTAAASYFALAVLLEWQALRGQSILQPDTLTVNAWIAWLVLSGAAFLLTSASVRKSTLQTGAGTA